MTYKWQWKICDQVKEPSLMFLSLQNMQYFIQTLSKTSIKKLLKFSKSLIKSYQNSNMSEANNLKWLVLICVCLTCIDVFLSEFGLKLCRRRKLWKICVKWKKKEEGSLLPLWRRTVYKVKKFVQKGSVWPDLKFWSS